MVENHKHKGVERTDGTLRPHPVTRKHKDGYVQRCHNLAIANANRKLKKPVTKKVVKKAPVKKKVVSKPTPTNNKVESVKKFFGLSENQFNLPIDDEGYVFADLTKMSGIKGLRVQFQRTEGRKKRTVGVQFEK